MDKPWLKQYPPQVPAEVDVRQFGSIPAMLDDSFTRFADRPAFSNLGAAMSYREVDQLSRQFAAWLQGEAGVGKGDRVAIMLPNLLQYPVVLFGALRAGAVVVNTNPLYTARELEHQLVDSGATCLVVLENFAHTAQEVLGRTQVRTVVTQGGQCQPHHRRQHAVRRAAGQLDQFGQFARVGHQDTPGVEQIEAGRMKIAIAGGMAVQKSVAERWQRLFGLPIIEGYGLTECSAIVSANPLTIGQFNGTVGLPVPSTEVAILDEKGEALPYGTPGEIAVRGPQVMAGYWNRPAETASTFTGDGWLRTGDIGTMDADGFLRVVDRIKDIIVVSGFKVVPNEVEDVAMMHPGVAEAAAIGVPDPRSGEAVALVVLRRDPALTEEALVAHCRQYLTAYKVPRDVRFREQPLPKSNIGKILRRVVRDEEAAARR